MPRQREILEHHTRGQQSFLLHQISTTASLLVELALVEGELLTLQDVTVAATRLAGSAGDNSEQSTGLELLLDGALDLAAGGMSGSLLLLNGVGLLDLLLGLALLGSLSLLASSADGLAVVGLVPLSEGGGIDLDDGALGQGVGSDQLVVGGVVGDTDDTGLAGAALGAPGEVARVETEGTVLVVTTTSSDGVDALGANTGVGTLATSLESALLPCCQRSERMSRNGAYGLSELLRTVVGALGTGGGALVSRVTRDTHDCGFCEGRDSQMVSWMIFKREEGSDGGGKRNSISWIFEIGRSRYRRSSE